jgi:hypothetical protein
MRRNTPIAIALAAVVLAGCGGDDDTTADSSTPQATVSGREADERQIRQVVEKWAPLFGTGKRAMCRYLHPSIAGGCDIYTGAQPSDYIASFASAEIISVDVDSGAVQLSNGEQIEVRRSGDTWAIADTGI